MVARPPTERTRERAEIMLKQSDSFAEPCLDRRIVNAMSVDVEDYYQVWALSSAIPRANWGDHRPRVERNTCRILEMFADYGMRATFFMLGCVAERHPTLVQEIVNQGHELASHGYAHYRVSEQGAETFLEDVSRTKKLLEDLSGVRVKGYRAASFSINQDTWWAFDVLEEAGYCYSSSIHPIRHDHYGMPNAPRFPFQPNNSGIKEIPVATAMILGRRVSCAGGGYFRLLPYRWSRFLLRQVNWQEGQPATFYFHPWEIDPGQPVIKDIPLRSRFRHYTNLHLMEKKLRRLLSEFAWSRIDEVYAQSLGAENPVTESTRIP